MADTVELTGFQESASFAGVEETICAQLPVEWPVDMPGIARVLKSAGYSTEHLTETAQKIEVWRPAPVVVPAPEPAAVESAPRTASMDILPSVPDDTSFLDMLKVGGVLKIQAVDVIAAMRAAIASTIGLYALPDALIERMEQFAKEQEEPVGESFYRLQKLITSRSYGEILSAIGVSGNFVSDKRKKELLVRLNDQLWPALYGFQTQLKNWADTWNQTGANPTMLLQTIAMGLSGGKAGMPAGMMMQPPDTAGLRDEAEAVITQVNKVFAGTGIPVARALGSDAVRIREVLEEPTLPAAVGSATKDQMLKTLGIAVGADYIRLERNITRYALSIMELPNVSAGNDEYAYLAAMLQLGAAIPWEKLLEPSGSGRGRVHHVSKVSDSSESKPY